MTDIKYAALKEKKLNKVVYVPAFFKPVFENVTKKVPTGEKKKGLFGGEKDITKKVTELQQTGYSDKLIDGERLSVDITHAVDKLNEDGYEVVSVTPLTSGDYSFKWELHRGGHHHGGSGFGYGYGYSYTEGVTIIAKKIA